MVALSERSVVDVLFDTPGQVSLQHRHPDRSHQLATITVSEDRAEPSLDQRFEHLRINPDMTAERERLARFLSADPHKTLAFIAEMDMSAPEGAVVYACPMHPDVVAAIEGICPQCGIKLFAVAPTYACPTHPAVVSESPDRYPRVWHEAGGDQPGRVDGALRYRRAPRERNDFHLQCHRRTNPYSF